MPGSDGAPSPGKNEGKINSLTFSRAAVPDLALFGGVRGSKKSIFPKDLGTGGESREMSGDLNRDTRDPPSVGIHPGTPPHSHPELWPIFMFWPHPVYLGPNGLAHLGVEKIDFFKIPRNRCRIEGNVRGSQLSYSGPSIRRYSPRGPPAHPARDVAHFHVLASSSPFGPQWTCPLSVPDQSGLTGARGEPRDLLGEVRWGDQRTP